MNILIDLVPDTVFIDDMEYKINSDFRASILFELLMQDDDLEDNEKILSLLELYYPIIPKNFHEAIEKVMWFYRCGKEDKKSNSSKGSKSKKAYDFEYDADYIYSAFLTQYNIDLQDIKCLHWWKFRALFNALKEDNEFVKIMQYRSMDLKKIKDKNEKAFYRRMQNLYKLPSKKRNTADFEKLQLIEEKLKNGEDISGIL